MRLIENYLDQYGLITHRPPMAPYFGTPNGGDTLAREGSFFSLAYFLSPEDKETFNLNKKLYNKSLGYLEKAGIWIRHPDYPWNGRFKPNPWATSRDQMKPNIIAMGIYGLNSHLLRFLWRVLKRGILFGYQNRDVFFFIDAAMVLRAVPKIAKPLLVISTLLAYFSPWFLLPLSILCLGDLQALLEVLYRISIKDPEDVGDDVNLTLGLIQGKYFLETPISWLSWHIYKKYRDPLRCWQVYFKESIGAPPLEEYLALVLKRRELS